jgi:MIP family channel proteins
VQDRGLASYIAELLGTLVLVFVITSVVVLYVSVPTPASPGGPAQPTFGSDFAVVGLVHGTVLFVLVAILAGVSGAHLNPAVTVAAAILRRIDPIDAVVYILAQLSGGVAGALLTKALLNDEGRLGNYGAVEVSNILGSNFAGFVVEGIGAFLLVLAVLAVAFNPRARSEWAPLAIGLTLGFVVMVFGPLTGGSVNPARWFGPALVGNEFGGIWPYVLGPIVGSGLAAAVYAYVIVPGQEAQPPVTKPEPKFPEESAAARKR